VQVVREPARARAEHEHAAGRGARERILSASQQLFREQGINRTGMDQLCAAARVSKRTAYQHFTGKDELVAEYLRRFDPDVTGGVFDRTDLTPRELLTFTPLIILALWIGLYPKPFFEILEQPVNQLVVQVRGNYPGIETPANASAQPEKDRAKDAAVAQVAKGAK